MTNGTNPTSPLANTVASGNCYKYQYVVSDNVGNTSTASSATVLKVTLSYADTVNATAGLLNYYRLGETTRRGHSTASPAPPAPRCRPTPRTLETRGTGGPVTPSRPCSAAQGRLRKSTISGGVGYYSNEILTSADYLVETDITVKSLVGTRRRPRPWRHRTAPEPAPTTTLATTRPRGGQFQLIKSVNGSAAVISTYNQTFTVGSTYTLGLDMKGSLIRMLVNDVQRTSINDGSITAAGRAGVGFGEPGDAATPSETAGLHLDNFNVPGGLATATAATTVHT